MTGADDVRAGDAPGNSARPALPECRRAFRSAAEARGAVVVVPAADWVSEAPGRARAGQAGQVAAPAWAGLAVAGRCANDGELDLTWACNRIWIRAGRRRRRRSSCLWGAQIRSGLSKPA